MKAKQTGTQPRSFVLVLDRGEEIVETLVAFAREHEIRGAFLSALGACERTTVAYWEWESKKYRNIEVDEQVEVLSLTGNLARTEDDQPRVHAHVALGKRDGSMIGGHLVEGRVRPTLELLLIETADLQRKRDEETGLQLIV